MFGEGLAVAVAGSSVEDLPLRACHASIECNLEAAAERNATLHFSEVAPYRAKAASCQSNGAGGAGKWRRRNGRCGLVMCVIASAESSDGCTDGGGGVLHTHS